MSEEKNEEKLLDFKGTLEQFVKPDEPEMSQEEAIIKYEENKKSSSGDENNDNTEEKEHLKRVKQELLASLERVKQLEKQMYSEKEVTEKKKIKVEKASSSGYSAKISKDAVDLNIEQAKEQKERE